MNDPTVARWLPVRARRPLVARLLRHAAGAPEPLGLVDAPEGAIRWLLEGGLGPLLWHAARSGGADVPARWQAVLKGADLTARLRHADLVETACEVIDAGAAVGVPVTLLKGVSVSEQLYPAEHLRPMGDVDVLVPRDGYQRLEAALLDNGYRRVPYPEMPGHHHGTPLRHRTRRTLVELHLELFPESSPLRRPGRSLAAATIASSGAAGHYHGRPVSRLSPEAQLRYIAASWFNDLTLCLPHPAYLASLFDAVYLIRRHQALLDPQDPAPIDNPIARGSLLALLTYLPRFGVPAPSAARLRMLRQGPASVAGPLELRLIHAMLDRTLVAAQPWAAGLPPPVPGRYSLMHQLRKRWAAVAGSRH